MRAEKDEYDYFTKREVSERQKELKVIVKSVETKLGVIKQERQRD